MFNFRILAMLAAFFNLEGCDLNVNEEKYEVNSCYFLSGNSIKCNKEVIKIIGIKSNIDYDCELEECKYINGLSRYYDKGSIINIKRNSTDSNGLSLAHVYIGNIVGVKIKSIKWKSLACRNMKINIAIYDKDSDLYPPLRVAKDCKIK